MKFVDFIPMLPIKRYYNSTCFIDHIFLKGYHPSINQHLITVIIINGINATKQAISPSGMKLNLFNGMSEERCGV